MYEKMNRVPKLLPCIFLSCMYVKAHAILLHGIAFLAQSDYTRSKTTPRSVMQCPVCRDAVLDTVDCSADMFFSHLFNI